MVSLEGILKTQIQFKGSFIEGEWQKPERNSGTWEVTSPANIDWVLPSPSFNFDLVAKAVGAGRAAKKNWARLGLHQRVEKVRSFSLEISKRADLISKLLSLETGKPLSESLAETDLLRSKTESLINEGLKFVSSQVLDLGSQGRGEIHYLPKGLIVVIGPVNLALSLPHGFITAALLSGNSVIFKPSEKTPLSAQVYAEAAEAAGFGPGVFQLLQGGPEMGSRLVRDTDVDGVVATCTFDVGTSIQKEMSQHPQRLLALHMGAKNAAIVWSGTQLDTCAETLVRSAFMTTGQRCTALPRVYVEKSLIQPLVQKVHAAAKELTISHPFDEDPRPFMGPLMSSALKERFFRYTAIAEGEGAEVVMRSKSLDSQGTRLNRKPLPIGYYVTPSIHVVEKPNPKSAYQNHEIFGPDLFFCPIESLEEGIAAVNSCGYGLAFSFFGGNEQIFHQVANEIESGLAYWNRGTVGSLSRLPFGGWKKSGNHRPGGIFSLLTMAQVQTRISL